MSSRFDWDVGNWPKCGEHGVSRVQIESIFGRPETFVGPDLEHSLEEDRWIAVGREALTGRAIFVVFTVRASGQHGGRFRPLSARFMHAKEFKRYAEDTH